MALETRRFTSTHQKARQIVSYVVVHIFSSRNVQISTTRSLLTKNNYLTNRPFPQNISANTGHNCTLSLLGLLAKIKVLVFFAIERFYIFNIIIEFSIYSSSVVRFQGWFNLVGVFLLGVRCRRGEYPHCVALHLVVGQSHYWVSGVAGGEYPPHYRVSLGVGYSAIARDILKDCCLLC